MSGARGRSHDQNIDRDRPRVEPDGPGAGPRRPRGLTLVETLVAVAIVSIAVLGLSFTTTAGHQHLRHGEASLRATRLAEHLLEEVRGRPYAGTGPDRSSFCVDDYDGWTETPGTLGRASGELYDEVYQGYTRAASVSPGSFAPPSWGGAAISGKTVTVTLTDARGRSWSVSRLLAEPTP